MSSGGTRGDDSARVRDRLGRSLVADGGRVLRDRQRTQGAEAGADSVAHAAAAPTATDPVALRGALQARLLAEIDARALAELPDDAVAEEVRAFVATVLATEDVALNEAERARLADDLTEEALGVGPLAPLLADPAVTDVLVNSADRVYVERHGRLERAPLRFRDDEHLQRTIARLAARAGRRIDAASPMVDLRLPDGSRVNATLPPVSLDGPTLSIRRFGIRRLGRDDLLRLGSASEAVLGFLELAVRERRSMLISGGTGAGKSTLLGILADAIPAHERIVTIEETAELRLQQEHVVRLEARPPNAEGRGEIVARELVRNALRMRPDRVIVGEVRGGEALDMLQAMNTGHDGSLCTIHANSPRDALSRLETLVLFAGFDLPSRAVREQIASALDLLVHVRRYEDGVRRIESVAEIVGLEGPTPLLQEIFRFEPSARRPVAGARLEGEYVATGIVPRFVHALRARGVEISLAPFQARAGERRA